MPSVVLSVLLIVVQSITFPANMCGSYVAYYNCKYLKNVLAQLFRRLSFSVVLFLPFYTTVFYVIHPNKSLKLAFDNLHNRTPTPRLSCAELACSLWLRLSETWQIIQPEFW